MTVQCSACGGVESHDKYCSFVAQIERLAARGKIVGRRVGTGTLPSSGGTLPSSGGGGTLPSGGGTLPSGGGTLPSGGGKLAGNHYYRVAVTTPVSPELGPYTAECADIIEALDMTFNEGENFKAIWRLAAARQGRGKAGNKPQYDADKAAHYGGRVAAQTRAKETHNV